MAPDRITVARAPGVITVEIRDLQDFEADRPAQKQVKVFVDGVTVVVTKTNPSYVDKALAWVFGVVFMAAILTFSIIIPNPSKTQFEVFRIVIAVAAGGVAAVIPGLLHVEAKVGSGVGGLIRAGGALAVFIVVFFWSPAHWG